MKMSRMAMGMALVFGALALGGCAAFKTADPYAGRGAPEVTQAKQAMMAGSYDRARQSLLKALAEGPSAEAHYYMALISLEESGGAKRDQAMAEAGRSIEDFPTAQAFLLRGCMLERSKPSEAAQCYKAALERSQPTGRVTALIHRNLAAVQFRCGETDEAFAHMKSYVEMTSPDGRRLTDDEKALWGLMLYQKGMDEQASGMWASIRSRDLRAAVEQAVGTGM